jgi:phosphatidate cytidylyltransferase
VDIVPKPRRRFGLPTGRGSQATADATPVESTDDVALVPDPAPAAGQHIDLTAAAASGPAEPSAPSQSVEPAEAAKAVATAEPAAPAAPTAPATRAAARAARSPGRAGRNLPAAVLVGAVLGGVVIASLFVRKEAFVGVVILAIVVGVWEMTEALAGRGIAVPLVPVTVGAVGMLIAAYAAGGQALAVCFALTSLGVVVWRVAEGAEGAVRDVAGGVLVAAYPALLGGFALLLLSPKDGSWRALTFILVTISSDIGGYAAGVLFGKHPMAPSVSPKKSWEGFAGSVLTCALMGVGTVTLFLHGSWWAGALAGLAAVVAATLGDLGESLIKRDLGIKDMGSLLPGHGGVLDRIDSLLFAAPVIWLLLHGLVSVH